MPRPMAGESRAHYVSRFMGDERMKRKYPKKQRLAIAYSEYRGRPKKADAKAVATAKRKGKKLGLW